MTDQTQPFLKSKFWMVLVLTLATLYFWYPLLFDSPDVALKAGSKNLDKFCRNFLVVLHSGDQDKAIPFFDPKLSHNVLKLFPDIKKDMKHAGTIQSAHLIQCTQFQENNLNCTGLDYYIDYERDHKLLDVVTIPRGNSYLVEGFHNIPVSGSYEENMVFSFKGRSWVQSFYLGLAYVLFLFCAASFVSCAQSEIKGRLWKLLWMAAILIGTIPFTMVWVPSSWHHIPLMIGDRTAEVYSLKVISFPLCGILKDPFYDPWKICISIPIGLICYYLWKPYKKKA